MSENQAPHRFRTWELAEANYASLDQTNTINYNLMLWEQGKWEKIYRLAFPEEAPWPRPETMPGSGITCSPYQWGKLMDRLKDLLASDKKAPAFGWDESTKERYKKNLP